MAVILSAILNDVTGPQQCRNTYYIPHPLIITGFLTLVKSLAKNTTKTQGDFLSTPSPPTPDPLYHRGGMRLHVLLRVHGNGNYNSGTTHRITSN